MPQLNLWKQQRLVYGIVLCLLASCTKVNVEEKYLSGQATTINCTSLFDWSDTNIHVLTWNVVLHSTGYTTMISENYFCSVNIVGGSMAEG